MLLHQAFRKPEYERIATGQRRSIWVWQSFWLAERHQLADRRYCAHLMVVQRVTTRRTRDGPARMWKQRGNIVSIRVSRSLLQECTHQQHLQVLLSVLDTHCSLFLYGHTTYESNNANMRTSSLILSFAAATLTVAQDMYWNVTSDPFYLHVTSDDDSTVNEAVGACHIGAAIESLCLSPIDDGEPVVGSVFNFNTSIWSQEPEVGFGIPGILTYWLPTQPMTPSSMLFSYDLTTNLALPIIYPGDQNPQSIAFDAQDQMVIQWYTPGDNNTGAWVQYYRWYACAKTYWSGYRYANLGWGLGAEEPGNPSCVAVNVTRVFL
jgi:hypothetical protein